jgi:hypothetical protein
MHRDYSLPGCSGSTSTSSCTVSTHLPTEAALHQLRHASGCLGTSRGSSRRSSSTTSPTPRVWVPQHIAWLIACRRLLRLRRASGCLGTSRGSSRGSLRGSSSTTSPTPRVRVPRHVVWLISPLVVDYSVSRGSSHGSLRHSSSTTPPRAGSPSTTLPPPRVRVPRHVAGLVSRLVAWLVALLIVDYSASRRLVADYFASAARPGASARHATRLADRHAARRRLLRLRRTSGCLGTSHGSSCGSLRRSSSTTSSTPRVRVPQHVARPVTRHIVDYSVCRDFVLRPRWLYFSQPCVVTTCLAATLALLRVCRAPPRRRLPVASRRPFISTCFPN